MFVRAHIVGASADPVTTGLCFMTIGWTKRASCRLCSRRLPPSTIMLLIPRASRMFIKPGRSTRRSPHHTTSTLGLLLSASISASFAERETTRTVGWPSFKSFASSGSMPMDEGTIRNGFGPGA